MAQSHKIRIILIGACGRMGSAIAQAINMANDIEIAYGIENPGHPNLGLPFFKGYITDNLEKVINEADLCVEFTNPQAVLNHLAICCEYKKPFLTGTTGFKEAELSQLKSAGSRIPILYSPNFSLGVNILFETIKNIAPLLLENYETTIIETHHKKKKDAPSGTAKKLAEIIKEKKAQEVNIVSLRLSDVIGEHRLIFSTEGEIIEIKHTALSRLAFANGVLEGIRFLSKMPPGFYTFESVIKGKFSDRAD